MKKLTIVEIGDVITFKSIVYKMVLQGLVLEAPDNDDFITVNTIYGKSRVSKEIITVIKVAKN